MATQLTYLNGPDEGQKITLDSQKSEFIIGRSPTVEFAIDNKNISRKHCKLKQDIDGVWIEDLKSKNGVKVNQKKITEPVLLNDNDEIELGDLKLLFTDSNAAILKRLSVLPAFAEPEAAPEAKPDSEEPKVPSEPLAPPHSPVLDYVYMGLMALVVIGLAIGALLWLGA
ncbi:MAG: FHA domain-containing protein [Myxococcaceae bacterium]